VNGYPEFARLSADLRTLVFDLIRNPAVQRLGGISQLGFSTFRQQTRLQHTIESIEIAGRLLEKASSTTPNVRKHLVAAIALEDVGRAPFSNSLDRAFDGLPDLSRGRNPIDIQRSIVVLEYLERTERLLSRQGLSCATVCDLLERKLPWRATPWINAVLNGPTDVDRLQYVSGDIAFADGTPYNVDNIARGVVLDSGADNNVTVIDDSAVLPLIDFLMQRTRLYLEIYYEPVKLALECVVSSFLRKLWNFADSANEEWSALREPRSVEKFLMWTDATVVGAFEGNRWDCAPEELKNSRHLIRDGKFQVAELRKRGATAVDLNEIDRMLGDIRGLLAQREHCWVLDGKELPTMRPYYPETIVVQHRKTYRSLETVPEFRANSVLLDNRRRCPLVVFPVTDFPTIQSLIHDVGLVFTTILPVDQIGRFAI